jgi:NAD(P)-dependent dehydrogenase (short-subunit alcohol dehydrogenase family)
MELSWDFNGRGVLVTGAARGIGRETAQMFAAAGARVAIHYRGHGEEAAEAYASLAGGPHALVYSDIADADGARALVEEAVSALGRIDVLVNNVATFEEHRIAEASYEEWCAAWRRTIDANLIGAANVTFCAARHMIASGGGRIVNVSSRGAFRGEPDAPAYGASKAGLNAMSQSLAQALAPHSVFVYVVAPGFVETERVAPRLEGAVGAAIRNQSPLGRVARVDEVARTVLFLASEGTDFLTGCIVDVNGASYLRT